MRKNLKEARIRKQLTHKDMADYIGLVRTSYTNIEMGVKNPSERVANKIKEILEDEGPDLLLNEADDAVM